MGDWRLAALSSVRAAVDGSVFAGLLGLWSSAGDTLAPVMSQDAHTTSDHVHAHTLARE